MIVQPKDESAQLLAIVSRLWRYCPVEQELVWRKRPLALFQVQGSDRGKRAACFNGKFYNYVAGGKNRTGHRFVAVNSVVFRSPRVVWALHAGVWPDGDVVHADGDVASLRVENLRMDGQKLPADAVPMQPDDLPLETVWIDWRGWRVEACPLLEKLIREAKAPGVRKQAERDRRRKIVLTPPAKYVPSVNCRTNDLPPRIKARNSAEA